MILLLVALVYLIIGVIAAAADRLFDFLSDMCYGVNDGLLTVMDVIGWPLLLVAVGINLLTGAATAAVDLAEHLLRKAIVEK